MIALLIQLLVVLLVCGLLLYLVDALPLEAPFKLAARALIVLVAILWLLSVAGLLPHDVRAAVTSLQPRQ
jgi:hypothetical protein